MNEQKELTATVAQEPPADLKAVTAKNIASLRTARKMTQLELGEALSYSDKAISKWERGEAVPDAYVLLELSRIFEVSVDWLLTPHEETMPPPPPPREHTRTHLVITLLSFFGVWLLATVAFVMLAILDTVLWQIFVYAIPASITVILVFNSLWGRPRHNYIVVGLLVPSLILCAYVACLPKSFWMLFLLLPPAELMVLLSRFLLRKKK